MRCCHWPGQTRCEVCGMDNSKVAAAEMRPAKSMLLAQDVAGILDIMQDYRMRRLRWMKEHPEHIGDDDAVPAELTREAEAAAIIDKLWK